MDTTILAPSNLAMIPMTRGRWLLVLLLVAALLALRSVARDAVLSKQDISSEPVDLSRITEIVMDGASVALWNELGVEGFDYKKGAAPSRAAP